MKQNRQPPEETYTPIDLSGIEDRYYLFGMLTAFANRMQTVGDHVFEEVTWKQWFALLGATVLQPNPSVSQVAGFVGTSHQNMKQLLLRLQSAGLVLLIKDESDLRRTLVKLTPSTEAFELKYRESSGLFMDRLFEGISSETLATARQVIYQLDQNLRILAKAINRRKDSA
jgi:DNA-binding MarR family transcriptional regulator